MSTLCNKAFESFFIVDFLIFPVQNNVIWNTGVIPIDRLTDVRAPVAVIGERVPRSQLQEVYGIKLPRPEPHENPNRYSSLSQVFESICNFPGGTSGMQLKRTWITIWTNVYWCWMSPPTMVGQSMSHSHSSTPPYTPFILSFVYEKASACLFSWL